MTSTKTVLTPGILSVEGTDAQGTTQELSSLEFDNGKHRPGKTGSAFFVNSDHSSDTASESWCSDDWETPNNIAEMMGAMVRPWETALEPFAGTGQILRYIDGTAIANELNPSRFAKLPIGKAGSTILLQGDFFSYDAWVWDQIRFSGGVDVVVTNPPFSRYVEAIEWSLKALKKDGDSTRLLFLGPHDWDQSQKRNADFQRLNCHIAHVYKLVGRAAYLKNGFPHKQRQIYDAIFDIRPGREPGCITYLKAK